MTLTQLAPPYPIFTDKSGSPLDNGYLYFGTVNLNPETNPIQVYYDAAGTQPAAQPLRTSNGYVMRNGSPTIIYANARFSVTVRDKSRALVIYSPNGFTTSNTNLIIYNEGATGAVDRVLTSRLQDILSVKDFGAVGDGVTDDTAAVQAAVTAGAGQKTVYFPAGVYALSSTLNVNVAGMSLVGERNNYTYGIGAQSVHLKWTAGSVCINTYVAPNSSTSGANSPYITLQNLTINGNSIAQVGIDGGFVLKMENCSVLGCTVAGLRLGTGSQTSKFYNCGFNGNKDGVVGLGGGTHYFYDCVFRQNTQHGVSAAISNSSFYNCIFESNTEKGVYLTGDCDMMLFDHCYFEQNDVAAVPNAYHVYASLTDTLTRKPQIKFETTVFGSTSVIKVANAQAGGLTFDNCLNVGDPDKKMITATEDSFVRYNNSFLSSSALLPAGMGEKSGVFFDPAKALICEGVAGRVVLSTGIALGTANFSVSLVCAFNDTSNDTRSLVCGDASSFAMIMTGSTEGVRTLNFGKTGSTLQSTFIKTAMTADVPIHIIYVREGGAFKVFINGQKVASGTDANDYTGNITSIGGNGVSSRMEGRLYAAKIYSGALTFSEIWSLCKNGGNFVGTSVATELMSLEFENRIVSIIYDGVSQKNFQNFGIWAVPTSEAADFTPVVRGGTTAGAGTYSYQYGSYRLFDGYCYFQFSVKWTAHTGTGSLQVTGLPFVSRNRAGDGSAFATYCADLTFPAGATNASAIIGSNTNVVELRGVGTALAATAIAMDGSATLVVSGHYQVQLS
jgi:hypothetical protein